jgi:hypothetical protein
MFKAPPPWPMAVRRWALRTLALAVGVGLGLAVAEGALRWLAPPSVHFHVWPPGTQVFLRPTTQTVPGVTGPSRFTINSAGVRGRAFGQDDREYRMLAIGGSTTECFYLDDTEAWPFLVEEALKRTRDGRDVWVGNVGRAGANTRDHVLHVKYLLPQYPRIDVVLALVGANDLALRLAQGTHYTPPQPLHDPGVEARQIRRAFSRWPGRLQEVPSEGASAYKKTAIYQLVRIMKETFVALATSRGLWQDEAGEVIESWRANRRAAAAIIDELPDLTSGLEEFARNLNAIADLVRPRRLVLMTQPTLWRSDLEPAAEKLLWKGGQGNFMQERGKAYYSVRVLAAAMARYNQRLLDVCEDRRLDCIDLARHVSKTPDIFVDDEHFTEMGARLVAQIVSRHFAASELFRRSAGRAGMAARRERRMGPPAALTDVVPLRQEGHDG